jgi:hypothetical protein
MLKLALAALALGAVSAAADAPTTGHFCRLVVYKDYEMGFAYYAQLALAPECTSGQVARIRRSSTLNVVRNGAPYQPIDPPTGAWEVTAFGDNVPNGKQFTYTTSSWVWQYWTEKPPRWNVARPE